MTIGRKASSCLRCPIIVHNSMFGGSQIQSCLAHLLPDVFTSGLRHTLYRFDHGCRHMSHQFARRVDPERLNPLALVHRSLDQVVTSQPIAIIALTQSSGKYDIHCKMFSSERATSASLTRT